MRGRFESARPPGVFAFEKRRIIRMRKRLLLWLSVSVFVIPSCTTLPLKYEGSMRCMPCHGAIYETWKETLHNKSQQVLSYTNRSLVTAWDGTLRLKGEKIPEVTVILSEMPRHMYRVTLLDGKDSSKDATYTVVRTYGGWGWKQLYQVKIGGNHYTLPIQWNQATARWVPYELQDWYNEDGSLRQPPVENSFEMKCAGCHNTGLQMKKIDGSYVATYVDLNIGCEKCHGRGSDHADSPRAAGKILNPRKLPYERALEVCGQCHSRGSSVPGGVFEFPWNDLENRPYVLGEPLIAYFRFVPGLWEDPGGHSKSSHQQWLDFIKSGHFRAKILCYDCHNPHGGPGRHQMVKADFNNSLCLSCHGKTRRFENIGAVQEHTRHNYAPETRGTSRCSSCHMVRTGFSAEAEDIHSHDFKIIKPSVSLDAFRKDPRNVIPNSCNSCHREWAKDEEGYVKGARSFEALFGR
jgi:predicted CXXCH cytochrome family protein